MVALMMISPVWSLSVSFAQCAINLSLLIVTIVSVICAFRAYHHQKDRAKKDAACDLAKYYSEHIIHRYGFVNYVFTTSGLSNKIKNWFPYDTIRNLDRNELEATLDKNEVNFQSVETELMMIDPFTIYQSKIQYARTVEERHSLSDEYIVHIKADDGSERTGIAHERILQLEFNHEVTMLLNDLEWFAMSCRYGLADEKMLYQSLHQTFLSHIWLLYFYICRQNTCNEDKLYTNLIWLFNHWKDRLHKIQEKAMKNRAAAEQELMQAKKERELADQRAREAQDKVKATQTEIYTGNPLK